MVKQFLIPQLETLHFRIFGHEMSSTMRQFLRNISFSFVGGITASAIMMAITILAGRLLGPAEYGKYNLILTWAQLLMLVIIFGLDDAGVRAVAMAKTEDEKSANVSSPFYFIVSLNALAALILLLSPSTFIDRLGGHAFIIAILILSTALVFKKILDCIIRGLAEFRYQFYVKITEISVTALFFYFFFYMEHQSKAMYYVLTVAIGSAVVAFLYVVKITPYLRNFHFLTLKRQLNYAKYIFVGEVLQTAFGSLDKLIIARYLGVFTLGIYGAYYAASTNIIAQTIQMFLNVFYPSIAQADDKGAVFKKINHLIYLSFIPGVILLSPVIGFIMRLFGQQYGINPYYVVSFATLASLQGILTIYYVLITATSKSLYKKYLVRLNTINAVHIIIYGLAIATHIISIQLILLLLMVNLSVTIVMQRWLLRQEYQRA